MLNFMLPTMAANFLNENFSGNRSEVQVLDVACGTGKVAKQVTKISVLKRPRPNETHSHSSSRYFSVCFVVSCFLLCEVVRPGLQKVCRSGQQ